MSSERRPKSPRGKAARSDDDTVVAKGRKASTRKTTKATKAPAKRTPAKPRKPAAPRKRASKGPSVTAPVKVPRDWRRWFALEALTWGGGVAVGLGFAGWMTWAQARDDVAAYLADPPTTVPGVIWSAPIEVRPGQRASFASLAGDLLAAGYDRVETLPDWPPQDSAGVFTARGDTLEIWSAPFESPAGEVPGARHTVRIVDGRVVQTSDPEGVLLRPTVLGTVGDPEDRRGEVDVDTLSRWVEPALLAIEDSRFREHRGVDPVGVLRALASNLTGGELQGGSTLTQQLAKNLFLTPDRTLRRKVREAFFATALESELDKDRLLELYLGEVYLGQMGGLPLHGIEAASRAWFGRSAARLELHEAALVVGVIAAPNRFSPVRHPEAAVERRSVVLDRMVATGAITAAQAQEAKARPLILAGLEPSRVRRAPYAVDRAVDRAEVALGEGALASGGYQVWTTIQPVLQRAAEEAVAQGMAELDAAYPKAAGAQVALVAVRVDDGAVVAMVGGRSYATSPFNRAIDAHRQAGSTIKPLTLLAALDQELVTPATELKDEPIARSIDGELWHPTNYDGTYVGEITVRKAIESSRNIPAILLAEEVGPVRLQRFLRAAGLDDATNLPSAALGAFPVTPLQLAGAYTAFAGGGVAREPGLLLGISTADGEEVLALEGARDELASEAAAAQAVEVLRGVIERGTGSRAASYGVSGPVGGKTGTTDDYRDAWFVGFTPELAVAVWVGHDTGALGLSGSRAALPTWARFVAASGTLRGEFPEPEGLVRVSMCAESGRPARPVCEHTHDDLFVEGTEPQGRCDLHGPPTVQAAHFLDKLFRRRKPVDPEDVEVVEVDTDGSLEAAE